METIRELKARGYTVVVFSGGFRWATDYAQTVLGYDASFSNVLHTSGGFLTGLVGGDMMFDWSKGDMLQRLQHIMGIEEADTVAVGDGANDRSMFAHAGTRIAFCAKAVLRKEATDIIDQKELTGVLDIVR